MFQYESQTDRLLGDGVTELWARMRPYDPKRGQPHKTYGIAHVSMRFKAGEFQRVKPKLAKYLESVFPEGDIRKPCLFEIASPNEKKRILASEEEYVKQRRRAELLGEEQPAPRRATQAADDFQLKKIEEAPTYQELAEEAKEPVVKKKVVPEYVEEESEEAKETKSDFDNLWEDIKGEVEELKAEGAVEIDESEPVVIIEELPKSDNEPLEATPQKKEEEPKPKAKPKAKAKPKSKAKGRTSRKKK